MSRFAFALRLLCLLALGSSVHTPGWAQAEPQPLRSVFTASAPPRTSSPVSTLNAASAASSSFAASAASALGGSVLIGQGTVSYHSVDVAVDAQGGLHAAYVHYAGGEGGTMPVYYAYCPPSNLAACGDPTTWQRVVIGTNETFVQLKLTPGGAPRVLMHHETIATPWGGGGTWYTYAECDARCTTTTGWRSAQVVTNQNGGAVGSASYDAHTFDLDPQGRPRLVYQEALGAVASYYTGCDANCTTAANWWRVRLPVDDFGENLKHAALTFTPTGAPRVLSTLWATLTNEVLVYLSCTQPCSATSDWTVSEPLVAVNNAGGHRSWTLQVDGAGRPRFALTLNGETIYAWCDAACAAGANWYAYALDFGDAALAFPTLVLDAADRPRLAYQDADGLGYAWCDAACETDDPAWTYGLAEDDDVLDADLPLLPLSGCRQGAWLSGYRPSLALDAHGNPRFGHDGEHLMECYYDPSNPSQGTFVEAKWWASRVVFFDQPGTTTPNEDTDTVPGLVRLEASYPNPFNPETVIPFVLPAAAHARLLVYDLLGREVADLLDDDLPAGTHRIAWDAHGLASGTYLARLTVGGASQTQALTLSK